MVSKFQQANQLVRSGKLEEAVAAYRTATEENAGFYGTYQNLGETLWKLGRLDEAIAAFRQVVELNSRSVWGLYQLGELLRQQKQFEEAVIYLRRAVEIKSDVGEFYMSLGAALVELGSLDEAVGYLRRAVELNPLLAEAYYYLGVSQSQQQHWSEAVEYYRQGLEINSGDVEGCLGLAKALTQLGKWSEAVDSYRQVLTLSESGEVLFRLGQALGQLEQWEKAIAEYQRAINLGFAGAEVRHHLGYALSKLGRYEEAVVELRQVVEENPRSAQVRHQLGYALSQLGRLREAEIELRKAAELHPGSAVVWQQLEDVLQELGKREEALGVKDGLANNLYPNIKDNKIIVYTCNFGNYESIKEPINLDPRVEYILLTDDKEIKSENWNIIYLNENFDNPRRLSRLPKLLPHKYLPLHDISVYIDSTMEIKETDIFMMVSSCLQDKDIALYRHYARKCTYDEILHCRDCEVEAYDVCEQVYRKYKSLNFPENYGLFENGFIIRKNTQKIRELNEMWWQEYIGGSQRDQFSLMYCLWKLGVEVSPIGIGEQMRKNPFLNFKKHKYKSYIHNKSRLSYKQKKSSLEEKKSNNLAKVNWLTGGEESRGWAYENNAKRLIAKIRDYHHRIDSDEKAECAIFFDVLIHSRLNVEAETSIARIGGPRPLKRLFGDDEKLIHEGLQNFAAVICLNKELKEKLEKYHANVFLIPNGIDLIEFHPSVLDKNQSRKFTVGFAGSAKSKEERHIKGLDYVTNACDIAGVPLLCVGRGAGQVKVPHEKMIRDFYSKIDVLVHPVGAGREGTSNVILEALALGIPVITSRYAGYHGELLRNEQDALICDRNVDVIAKAIKRIKNDSDFAKKLSKNGRLFAEKHHDINLIADQYKKVIDQAVQYAKSQIKVSFVPFWLPSYQFASSRLRCMYPSSLLSESNGNIGAIPIYNKKSNVVIVTQSCNDAVYQELKSRSDIIVIYDVCDRYYIDEKSFPTMYGNVNSMNRFHELADIAKIIMTSTVSMKSEIEKIRPGKKVIYVPEVIDYVPDILSLTQVHEKKVVWFGNPGRGNFDSAKWILDVLKNKYNYEVIIISRKKSFKKYPDYYHCCIEWNFNNFSNAVRQASLCVLSHHDKEQTKSPNRLVTSIAHGIPTIVYNSDSYSEFLQKTGCNYAIVSDEDSLEAAVNHLSSYKGKEVFIRKTQKVVASKYGRPAIVENYEKLINSLVNI